MIEKAVKFLREVRVEVKKVTWPSRKEALGGTAVVLITVLLMSIYLGVVDLMLSKIVESIIKA